MLEIVSFFSLLFTAAVVALFARRILGAPIGLAAVDPRLLPAFHRLRAGATRPRAGLPSLLVPTRFGWVKTLTRRSRPRRDQA